MSTLVTLANCALMYGRNTNMEGFRSNCLQHVVDSSSIQYDDVDDWSFAFGCAQLLRAICEICLCTEPKFPQLRQGWWVRMIFMLEVIVQVSVSCLARDVQPVK